MKKLKQENNRNFVVPSPTGEEYIYRGVQMIKDEFNALLRKVHDEHTKMLWENVEQWVKSERKWLMLVSTLRREYRTCNKEALPNGLKTAIDKLLDYARSRKRYLSGKI